MSYNLNGADRALYHWHPVLLGSELGSKPAGVKVHGQQLVVFRTSSGVAALDDRCPHRGARLSTGCVEADRVVCPYHLWTFDAEGRGQSPVNPRMRPFTTSYDVAERHGIVWLKPREAATPFPEIDGTGLHFLGHYASVIHAPFPLVADNFTEIEHSPTNHFLFAFDAEGIRHVEPRVEVSEDSIHVVYAGPQRPQPWWVFGRVLGIQPGLRHVIDFRLRFSPLNWTYDLSWEDPGTGRPAGERLREYAFITPRDEKSTAVFLLFFTSLRLMRPGHPLRGLLRRFFLSHARTEFELDRRICENVADMSPRFDLDGQQLGRFDHVLRSVRRLTDTVYRRREPAHRDHAGMNASGAGAASP